MLSFLNENLNPEFSKIINTFILMEMKKDFFKYFIVYMKGGIYSDFDVSVL